MRSMPAYYPPDPSGTNGAPHRKTSAAQVALWWLMGVIGMLFTLMLTAYVMRMSYGDWQPIPAGTSITPLWGTTALLVLACAMLQAAVHASRHGELLRAQRRWAIAGLAAAAFLAGQLWVWHLLGLRHFDVAGNPANSFFYLLTGLHGLHVAGGLLVWAALARRRLSPATRAHRLALTAQYWHFLLALWLVLFAAIANLTPAIAQRLCGVG
ncbi:putative cytochrome c oxidase subunit 3 [Pandoraea terrae]|uniref:Putative cytochrome c oxidase subunit 3 n=1 Tax=Pandoraea terrae TaxID=1537710 RepID=A0A5E4Y8D9_9BURK|nr:cytochrome c oxidase subunit 3 [Pandoraea terrae]VVE44904.1 putative cytochrome c oxidase subunit 3 [Pandoraea terrae]